MTQPMSSSEKPDIVLTETHNWAAFSHEELYAAVHNANDPGRVGQLSDEWNALSREIGDAAQRMAEKVRGTETGWQGQAADAARAAIQELTDWNRDAGDTAGSLASRIAEQGRIMETAKAEMPEPVKGSEGLQAMLLASYANNDLESFNIATKALQLHQLNATVAHMQAVGVMAKMEEQSRSVDADTPRFTPPPNPLEEQRAMARMAPMAPLRSVEQGAPMSASGAPGSGGAPAGPADSQLAAAAAPDVPAPDAPAPDAPVLGGPGAPGGPGGIDGPTKAMPIPQLGDAPGGPGGGVDGPTKAIPKPQFSGPGTPNVPQLGDGPGSTTPQSFTPSSTTPQSFTPPNLPGPGQVGGDHLHQPRNFQGPDGPTSVGPGVRGPGNGRDRNQPGQDRPGWRGQVPPVPGGGPITGGPVGGGSPSLSGPGGGGPGGGGFRGGPGSVPGLGAGGGVGGGALGGAGGAGGGSSNLAPGGSTGAGRPGEAGFGGRGVAGAPGQPGAAGAAGMGGPMGAGAQRGRGEDDKERNAKYVQGGPVVEVPGADLPPPVIGEGRKKKRQQDQG